MNKIWLRIDCDNPIFYKGSFLRWKYYLNYASLYFNFRVPGWNGQPICQLKQFLASYDIPRVWFFRPETCPDSWDEPFGLHARKNDVEGFEQELKFVENKLGQPINLFTRHGFAPLKSGCLWSNNDLCEIENLFNVQDISDVPHYTVGRTARFNPDYHEHILFHPSHLYVFGKELHNILTEVINFNNSIYA